jgi:hypothetical protein
MAGKLRFNQLKDQIDRLRKDSLEVVANANKIVYDGVQKLADKELKALNDYYKSAVNSIKAAKRSDLKGAATTQIDLLHSTVNTVISHARESLEVVADARDELAKLVKKSAEGATIAESNIRRAVEPAKAALDKAKAGAKSAAKQAEKTVAAAKKEAAKVEKKVKAEVKSAEAKVKQAGTKAVAEAKKGVAAAKKAVAPSPTSRAARATSAAKKVVTQAVETATAAVNEAVATVTDAVKPQG